MSKSKKMSIESENEESNISNIQPVEFEILDEHIDFMKLFQKQNIEIQDYLLQSVGKTLDNQELIQKYSNVIEEWKKQPIELHAYLQQSKKEEVPSLLKELTEQQKLLVKVWNSDKVSEDLKDYIAENTIKSHKKNKKNKFSTMENQLIEGFYAQPTQFQEFLLLEEDDGEEDEGMEECFEGGCQGVCEDKCNEDGDEEELDEGEWESEDAFDEDVGLEELSEKDLEYINNIWMKQSDKLQNFIICKRKNPEQHNFTKQELQIIKDFPNQSKEVKYFTGYEFNEY